MQKHDLDRRRSRVAELKRDPYFGFAPLRRELEDAQGLVMAAEARYDKCKEEFKMALRNLLADL
jgi:hypothetical protein